MTIQQPTPPTPSDEKLEALLSSHLHATLDPQRGRALDAFRAHLAQEEAPASIPISRGVVPKRALWYWAGVPSLVAASLAVVITLQMVKHPLATPHPQPMPDNPLLAGFGGAPTPTPTGNIVFDQTETTRDLAGGIAVLPDNTPVRIIRRQGIRETNWLDPRENAVYNLKEEPIENVGYTQIQPF